MEFHTDTETDLKAFFSIEQTPKSQHLFFQSLDLPQAS